ncbi:uncharacterized protein [Engystomops pustulosus]|uniref:uncharacterized protein isoform X1 n=2 Tax=Engystomops pustulosus TaxID=76066 RepID=UPI003AFA9693
MPTPPPGFTAAIQRRNYPAKFVSYTRLSVEQFDYLLELCRAKLTRQDTVMRQAIAPEERLLITLRFLATGESYSSLHYLFLVGRSTICKIVKETSVALWDILQPIVMPIPNQDFLKKIAHDFYVSTKFPNCIGAIDGKHVRVIQPPNSGSQFYNYKKYFSLVLLAIADSKLNFICIEMGSYGSTNNARILESSHMGQSFLTSHLEIPNPQPLSPNTPPLPFVFIGDEAFGIKSQLMRPFCNRGLTASKRIFNTRLSRARRVVECAFGLLTNHWRILRTAMCLKISTVDDVVKACCVMHNFLNKPISSFVESVPNHECVPVNTRSTCNCSVVSGWRVRDCFTNYFVSEDGYVPWQDES